MTPPPQSAPQSLPPLVNAISEVSIDTSLSSTHHIQSINVSESSHFSPPLPCSQPLSPLTWTISDPSWPPLLHLVLVICLFALRSIPIFHSTALPSKKLISQAPLSFGFWVNSANGSYQQKAGGWQEGRSQGIFPFMLSLDLPLDLPLWRTFSLHSPGSLQAVPSGVLVPAG